MKSVHGVKTTQTSKQYGKKKSVLKFDLENRRNGA
jgi:hypothetical protein